MVKLTLITFYFLITSQIGYEITGTLNVNMPNIDLQDQRSSASLYNRMLDSM